MIPPKQNRRRAPAKSEKAAPGGPRKATPTATTGRDLKSRAARRNGESETLPDDPKGPKPFVKWAGGKRQLLAEIRKHLPGDFKTFHEPFVGGGAVFFAIAAGKRAYLSDSNERLVRTYRGIRDRVEDVIRLLDSYPNDREFFLKMRDSDIDRRGDAEVAAWFIYLNKLAFNGIYRVNSKNKFNVPFGDNHRAVICDRDNLRACAQALAHAEIVTEDFLGVEKRAQKDDLVYFDPPYFPVSATSYFTSYTARGFTGPDQVKLRDLAVRLKKKGVHVLLSNSPPAAELYQHDLGFTVREVLATRVVNSKAAGRGKITELLIT
jgi:DNA adenine methylase